MTIIATRPTHRADADLRTCVLAAVGLVLLIVVMLVAATPWSGADRDPAPTPGVTAPRTPTATPFGQA